MADFLDESFSDAPQDINLEDYVQTPEQTTSIPPLGAVRNRAATTALLSGNPEEAVTRYRQMLMEAQMGQSTTQKMLQQDIDIQTNNLDTKAIMNILADSSVPFETKQAVVKGYKGADAIKDNLTTLHTNLLANGSEGESKDQEEARISTADAIAETQRARVEMQGLVNAHIASQNNRGVVSGLFDALASVIPLASNVATAKLAGQAAEAAGQQFSIWDYIKAGVDKGGTKLAIRDKIAKMNPQEKVEFTKKMVDAIGANSSLIFGNDNQYIKFQQMDEIWLNGYTDQDAAMDTIGTILDTVGLGWTGRTGKTAARGAQAEAARAGQAEGVIKAEWELVEDKLPPSQQLPSGIPRISYEDKVKRIEANSPVHQPNPASPGQTANQSNPQQARAIYSMVYKAEDEEVANAMYGTSKEQALADGVIPQVATESHVVTSVPFDIGRELRQPQVLDELAGMVHNTGAIYFTPGEKAAARAAVVNDFSNATGMTMNEAMSSFRLEGGRVYADAVYGANDGSWSNAREAVDQALFALRAYGVSEEDITIMAKNGLDHVPAGAASPPPVQPGFVRFYHGGVPGKGKKWLSPDEKYARGYADKSQGGKVQYVDIPEDSPFLSKAFDDTGASVKAPYNSFEANEALSAQLKLFEGSVDNLPQGDYLVRVRMPYEFSAADIGNFDKLTTRFNWADRSPNFVWNKSGSISRYILDASSMIDPVITKGAVVAADDVARAQKTMLEYADRYAQQFVKFDDVTKAKIDDYIREANFNSIPFDQADLIARGFGPNEIAALKSWRDFWDGHFYLENYDVIRSLKARGFEVFENSQHTFYAKPIPKNINRAKVYDASQDIIRTLSKDELDDLYNKGGTLAAFRRPVNFNGEVVEQMMVRNQPMEYLRGFRDSDQVLNYRPGYFQIHYNAPKFIDEIERDAAGNIIGRRTVAVAGDTKEATLFSTRMQKNTGIEHLVRDDFKAISRDSDEYWDLQSASGRMAQRHRGKLLQDASAPNQLGDNSFVLNPVDSAIKAAKSIAGRTAMRNVLDTAKARIMANFPEAFPSNGMGGRKWPSDVKEVGIPGQLNSKVSADARTNWEYINYLENGYINSMDEAFKASFRLIASTAGERGLTRVERAALGISQYNPSNIGKGFVFNAYIASNPLRQFIVQPHQVIRTMTYNPVGWMNGNIPNYFSSFLVHEMKMFQNVQFTKDALEFIEFAKNYGGLAGVDHNNLVRGTLKEAANTTNRAVRIANKPVEILRTIGFDAGEMANQLGHLAAVFDRYKRLGLDVTDKAVRDEAYSEARALSWDMNKAGDMPYTQTAPSFALQFLQVPHKAWLQLTSRRLSWQDKARLLTTDMIMWGTPVATISAMVGGDILPDNEEARKYLTDGAESVLLNKLISNVTGETTNIDFSSLAPYSMDGWGKMFFLLSTDSPLAVIANSPAGQLFLKDGGRVQNAIGSMARWFNGHFDPNTPPETFLSMANEVAKISSGWSNGVKAKILLENRKVLDQYGNAIDPSVSTAEAWAQLFGFGTQDTRDYYVLSQKWSKEIKSHKEDVKQVVDDIFRYYKNQLQSENTDTEFVQGVIGLALQAFKDDPESQKLAHDLIKQRLLEDQGQLARTMMKRSGILDSDSIADDIRRMPGIDEQTRMEMQRRINDMQNAKSDYLKNKE